MEQHVVIGTLRTPLGPLGAVLTEQGLGKLAFAAEGESACAGWIERWMPNARVVEDAARLAMVAEQMIAYADGALTAFTVPLDLRGTPFQLAVWRAVGAIGYGQVKSYADVAESIGRPSAVRAVGAANGANPIPIIIPCHRVIGSNGRLTGYGGGLGLKERLLKLEGSVRQ